MFDFGWLVEDGRAAGRSSESILYAWFCAAAGQREHIHLYKCFSHSFAYRIRIQYEIICFRMYFATAATSEALCAIESHSGERG